MKRLLTLGLALFALASSYAQELSATELERARSYLQKTSEAFLASVAGLSDAQLNFKPGPTRWSVAEVSEHIAAAEDFLFGNVQNVMNAPARTEPANLKEID